MYRFPSTVDVRSVAPKGCVVTGDGICHQIKPFNGKLECLDSAHDCSNSCLQWIRRVKKAKQGFDDVGPMSKRSLNSALSVIGKANGG